MLKIRTIYNHSFFTEMLNYFCVLLMLILGSCSQKTTKEINSSLDDSVCDCIKQVNHSNSPEDRLNASLICLQNEAKNNRDTFFTVLNHTFFNCNGFAREMSELNLSIAGLDTVDFEIPELSDCKYLSGDRWKDVLADTTTFSLYYKDKVEHYSDGSLIGIWTIVSNSNCETTFVVTMQEEEQLVPPYLGDTIISKTIGIKDNMVKSLLRIQNFEIVSVGVKVR